MEAGDDPNNPLNEKIRFNGKLQKTAENCRKLQKTAENCRKLRNKEVFGILQAFDTAHCSSTEGETAHLL